MSEEIWKPIDGYEGQYEVSDHGRVRSLIYPTSAGTATRKKPRILTQRAPRADGYMTVTLLGKTHFVHALVATAFISARPTPEHQCCHRDGDQSNNHWTNLRWDTPAGNQQDRVRHGTDLRALKHPLGKLSDEQAKEIKRRRKAGEKGVDLAREFGVSPQLISELHCGSHRKWLGV